MFARISRPGFLSFHWVLEGCQALTQHLARGLCWIVQLQHGEPVYAVAFSPPAGGLVRGEGANVPRPDLEDVLHCGTLGPIPGNAAGDPKEIQ